jgi:hypothetical protein
MKHWWLVSVLALGACDDGETAATDGGAGGAGGVGGAGGAGGEVPDGGVDATVLPPPGPCDPLDPAACALPWPSSRYLAADTTRATGFALTFDAESLPKNLNGQYADPAPYRRLDGYGTSTQIATVFPNLDITGIPGELEVADSLAEDAPVVIWEMSENPRRIAYFAELDANEPDPAKQVLYVRPAEVLKESSRYAVAFRGLRDTGGAPIAAGEAFAKLRDGATADDPELAPRQARFDEVFAFLEAQGLDRGELVLAWDFHTASCDALHGPMLHIRDAGFAAVPEAGPPVTIDLVEEYLQEDDGSGQPVHPHTWLRLHGTFRVPHFMKESAEVLGVKGWIFNDGAQPFRPAQNGTRDPGFWLIVPHAAKSGRPMGLVNYGHGLFGNGEEVLEPGWVRPCGRFPERECGWWNARIANDHDLIFFGADLVGMSQDDYDRAALTIVQDVSLFPWISDRLHQGQLEYMLLARAMREQLAGLPELAGRNINVDASQLYYSGISQGGIFGAAYLALSPDTTRAHLGVPGQNYSMFLSRSTGFTPFFGVLRSVYPSTADQAVLLGAIQLLWDGTENATYLRHLAAEPFPGNGPKAVLATPTKGDYLVPPISFEVATRTPELQIPVVGTWDPERSVALATPVPYPHTGSGVVLYGLGNPWPAPGNRAPEEHPLGDPHEDMRHLDAHNAQMVHFFRTGEIIDVCAGGPCAWPLEEE